MDTLEAIRRRRSIRKFKPDPVAPELITEVLEAARLAPSGTNAQPWKFVVVRSPAKRQALCEAAYGQPMFRQAPVIVVALGDRKIFKKRLRRGMELVDIGAVDRQVMETVAKVYQNRATDPAALDISIRINCAIAVEHLILAAASLGLGSCWAMLIKAEEVTEVLDLPDWLFPFAMIPIGHADEDPPPRPRYPLEETAFDEDLDHPWPAREDSQRGC